MSTLKWPLSPPPNYVTEIDGKHYSLNDRYTHLAAAKYEEELTQQLRWAARTGYFLVKVSDDGRYYKVDVAPVSVEEAHDLAKSWGEPLAEYEPSRLTKVPVSDFNKRSR